MAEIIEFGSGSRLAPQPKDGYRAFDVSEYGQPVVFLFLIFRDRQDYLVLRHADLESIGPARGEDVNRVALLRFGGSTAREIRIEGRRLLDLVSRLRWQTVTFVKETPWEWDDGDDDRVGVHRIRVREIRP